jgi:hypothetical protein
MYRRAVLEALLATPFASDGYGFQIELVMQAHRPGSTWVSRVSFREREHGRSRSPLASSWRRCGT